MNDCQPLTHNIANKGFSGIRKFVARFKFSCNRIDNHTQSLTGHIVTVSRQCKKTTQQTICYLKTEKKNKIMNSPRTKLHICKPRHTSRCFSLQKSSFLADAPQEIEYLADYKFWTMKYEI